MSAGSNLSAADAMLSWPGSVLARQIGAAEESLHRRFAEAPSALMGPLLLVDRNPFIAVGLQHLGAVVELLAAGDAVELVEQGLMEALADAVGL